MLGRLLMVAGALVGLAVSAQFISMSLAATLPGDINNDTRVDVTDLSLLLSNYGKAASEATDPDCDVNRSGRVDIIDLSTLLANYGRSSSRRPDTDPKPAIPTGLKVTATTANSVTLDWNDSPDLRTSDKYQVYIDDRWEQLEATQSQYTATGLAPATSYMFRVGAGQPGSYGDWTDAVSTSTKTDGSSTPTPSPSPGPVTDNTPCVYFVALSGSDGANGSQQSPFRTLTKAASLLYPGQAACVRGGTYPHERVNISKSGTASSPIVVKPYQSEKVIYDAQTDTVGGGNRWYGDGGLFTITGSNVLVQGFELKNAPTHGLHVSGENIILRGNFMQYIWMNGIEVWANKILIEDNEMHHTAMNNHNNRADVWAGGLMVRGTGSSLTDHVVRRNFVHEVWGEALSIERSNKFLMQDNVVRNAHSVSFGIAMVSNGVMERNFGYADGNWSTSRYPARAFAWGGEDLPWAAGSNNAVNVTVRNNIFANQGDAAFVRMSNQLTYSNFKFIGNTFYNAGIFADAMINGSGSGNILKNNIIKGGVHLANRNAWDISHNAYPDGNHYGEGLGNGPGNLQVNPLFVSPGMWTMAAYKLQPSSPLKGKGTPIGDLSQDFWHSPRTNPPTIGAHEL